MPSRALKFAVESLAVRAVALPARLLPRPAALGLGAALGRLAWTVGVRRRLVLSNLGLAMPGTDLAERRRVGRTAAENLGRTMVEFLRFAGRDRRRVDELVSVEGLPALREGLAEGRGAVLVTAHLGAWALYVTALAAHGVDAALLVGAQHNPRVDRLILGIPGDAVRFISKGSRATRRVLECLREGRAVVMVADHYSSPETVWAPFLGRSASTLPLPGSVVAKLGTPLYLMAGVRREGGRHLLRLRRLELPAAGEQDELRIAIATLCNRELGGEILAAPDQYWWYHDRWKVRGVYRLGRKVLGCPPQTDREEQPLPEERR